MDIISLIGHTTSHMISRYTHVMPLNLRLAIRLRMTAGHPVPPYSWTVSIKISAKIALTRYWNRWSVIV